MIHKKFICRCLLLAAATGLLKGGSLALAQELKDEAEWTVMIYMCGSDLESRHGLATYNLEEMAAIRKIDTVTDYLNAVYDLDLKEEQQEKVHVVMETGGCTKWQAEESLGMQISNENLQRWYFEPLDQELAAEEGNCPFTLLQEAPSASMGDAQTLADFISWSAAHYPARKYALLLWDHGGGSLTGIFVDELFDNDILYLSELDEAMAGGGVHFETIVLDACLMANLETAQILAPYADYMVASEEESSGYGSAIGDWIRELYLNPGCDGKEFGFSFCNTLRVKYGKLGDQQARNLLTYSVTDLSKIEELADCVNEWFVCAGEAYEKYPSLLNVMNLVLYNSEKFGSGKAKMVDIGAILYDNNMTGLLPPDLRSRTLNALSQAMRYVVCGDGRSSSCGLSFCYAVNLDPQNMAVYAANCRLPAYLAYLDALTDWEAPEEIYEHTKELMELKDTDNYEFTVEMIEKDGFPAAAVDLNDYMKIGYNVKLELYRKSEKSGSYIRLGSIFVLTDYLFEENKMLFCAPPLQVWPAIEGETLCDLELVEESNGIVLYNIPIMMNNDHYKLRGGITLYKDDGEESRLGNVELYGLWSGYDEDTGMPNRNVLSPANFRGREYQLLYPIMAEGEESEHFYETSDYLTMSQSLDLEEIPLPEGDYAVRYILSDVFDRYLPQDLVKLHWDGETFTIQD